MANQCLEFDQERDLSPGVSLCHAIGRGGVGGGQVGSLCVSTPATQRLWPRTQMYRWIEVRGCGHGYRCIGG